MKTQHLSVPLLFLGAAVAALATVHTSAGEFAGPRRERLTSPIPQKSTTFPPERKTFRFGSRTPGRSITKKYLKANVTSPVPTKIFAGAEYGNKILHIEVKDPSVTTIPITMEFTVRRSEHLHNDFTQVSATTKNAPPSSPDMKRWLEPDRLVPLDQKIREMSAEITAGKTTELEKARAIYDYVLANMKYDKSGTGWGNGDIYWACDAKRGNCTDFHALFIGLARSAGIPAKFEIGLPVPADKASGEIGGYHCWAEFYLNGYGWVPVDASEAWKDPSRRDYFFGAHDANRVQFSVGRDVTLTPPQSGPALNFFIYPYVEVDGKPFTQVTKKFSFRDVTSSSVAAVSGK